jgi:hypothetical protein
MSSLRYCESIVVASSPETLYDMVFDVTRMGEWSPAGIDRFRRRFGGDAEAQIAVRTEDAHRGIPVTLAGLKQAAEAG